MPSSKKDLERLLRKKFTVADIADVYGVKSATVRRWLKAHGLKVAARPTPDELLEEVRRRGSCRAAADHLGLSYQAVAQRLKRHFPHWSGSTSGVRYSAADRSRAMSLYIDGVEIDEICARIGCSRTTVTDWAREDKVGRGVGRRRTYEPKEAVELYEKLGSQQAVAEVLGVSPTSVWRALREAACST